MAELGNNVVSFEAVVKPKLSKIVIQGDSWKLIFLNVLLLGIKSHLRAPMVWKIFLIEFHFDNGDEKVSNVLY